MKTNISFGLVVIQILLNLGCSDKQNVNLEYMKPKWSGKIQKYDSCATITSYIESFRSNGFAYPNDGAVAVNDGASQSNNSQHYQNQVNGIVEGDIVQSSNRNYFFARESSIEVIDKGSLSIVKSIPVGLYQYNNVIYKNEKLFFVGSNYDKTIVKIFDENNNYNIIFEQEYKGTLVDYRLVDDDLVVVYSSYFYSEQNVEDCSNIYQPSWMNGSSQLTSVSKVTYKNSSYSQKTIGIIGGSQFIYMTSKDLFLFESNMYIESSVFSNFRRVSWKNDNPELQQVERFEGTMKDRFSAYQQDHTLFLAVTKDRFGDSTFSRYNQILSYEAAEESSNFEMVAESEKFGFNEDIRSILYHDHYAYVVTFQKTDPLFIVDLSNSRNLKILSEVQVPGFSSQLKLLKSHILAGIGFNAIADESGQFSWFAGLKVSLFNIEDNLKPFEMSSKVWGDRGSFSDATSEPKALYISENKTKIIFPAVIMKYDESMQHEPWNYATNLDFAGAILVKTEQGVVEEMGRLTHSNWREEFCGKDSAGFMNWWSNSTQSRDIQRVFEIEGNYISFSRFGVKLYDSESLEVKKELLFSNNQFQCQRIDNL